MRSTLVVCALALFLASGVSAQDDVWRNLADRALALDRAGNYTDAVAVYRDALRVAERFDRRDHRLLATLNWLAEAYEHEGRPAEAERHYRRALKIMEGTTGKNTASYAQVLTNLAGLCLEQGQTARAETMLAQSLATYAKVVPPEDASFALARNTLASLMVVKGRYPEAESLLHAAIAVLDVYLSLGRVC